MPIYEYLCNNCNTHQERYLSVLDYKTPQHCENCGKKLTRVISKLSVLIPAWWTNPDNDLDIAKPKTALEKKKYKEFMENSIPISRSTT